MPLLQKRRSVRDLLNSTTNSESTTPPSTLNAPAPAERPRSDHAYSRSRLSHEVLRSDIPDPKNSQDERAKRFSMLKFRNYSESHLAARAKEAERREKEKENAPPIPALPSASAVPAIVKTAPTMDMPGSEGQEKVEEEEPNHSESERKVRPSLFKRSMSKGSKSNEEKRGLKGRSPSKREIRKSTDEKKVEKKPAATRWRKLQGKSTGLEDLQRLAAANTGSSNNSNNSSNLAAPPSYGDESNSALALPVMPGPRFSESSRSDGSNGSDPIYGSTTTTTHTVSTHTTFFRLPRRNKNRNSLFPLPVKIPPPNEEPQQDDSPTPRASTGAFSSKSHPATPDGNASPDISRRHTETSPTKRQGLPPNAALSRSGVLSYAEPGTNLNRKNSQQSRNSSTSSPLQPPRRLGARDRASTTSSFGRNSHEMGGTPTGSGRNSMSTTGRASFGGLLTLSRFRQGSEPHSPRYGSPGTGSHSNSFAMSREALVVPEREEGDTPGKYLERLEAAVARSMIAGILSKSADPFAQAVLRSYTRRFPFFGEPIDMSLRKFLLEADLPKETQQVDRVIQAFADRYHECNPGIFIAPDQAYIIAFSLMMLHTDAFNKNNKRKMQKQDYIKNTSGQQVSDDVLGCFYDNICYTPFVHYEEEVDINGERVLPFKPKKNKVKAAITDSNKKTTGPVDPYNLLVEQKLDALRPAIKDTITMDDPYSYKGNQGELDPHYLQRAFTHTGVLQIISQRSRPTAYEGQLTNSAPPSLMEMQPGIIDIKITKVGTLWRKAAKKKKARSPWQEWGAILTGSQLYLFKNAHWAKGLVHQFEAAQGRGKPRTPVVFKPPLQEFKPDALIKTDNAVVLVDATYNRHKNAFTFVGPGGQEEVLLADNESELHDWLALINYAAAFRTAGVRIRGMMSGAEEDSRPKDLRRLESQQSTHSGEQTMVNRGISPQLARQVMAARRQIIVQKVGEATREITEATKSLENMLRNARHLLVLAPVAPKSREDVVHAAARADATIKWTRRNIWRIKCHKDILAKDVQLDGVSASEIETLALEQAEESGKKTRSRGLSRLNSKATSPPQSPNFHRPSTTGSLENYATDVFRTPPESATQLVAPGAEWRLPPLQLDVQPQDQHRLSSVVSSPQATSSQDRTSFSQASFTTSTTENRGRRPSSTSAATTEDREVELLARTTMSPDRMDGTPPDTTTTTTTTTATKQHHRGGVRRSLHKTLRDAHHHKRGKESESTVRSPTTSEATEPNENGTSEEGGAEEGTPGLKREKGRFILHGKQASVVQFGGEEWMKARAAGGGSAASPREWRGSLGFVRDVEVASAFAEGASVDGEEEEEEEEGKRRTVIGPASADAGALEEEEDDDNGSVASPAEVEEKERKSVEVK